MGCTIKKVQYVIIKCTHDTPRVSPTGPHAQQHGDTRVACKVHMVACTRAVCVLCDSVVTCVTVAHIKQNTKQNQTTKQLYDWTQP